MTTSNAFASWCAATPDEGKSWMYVVMYLRILCKRDIYICVSLHILCIYTYTYIYIYIWYPPKTYLSIKFNGIYRFAPECDALNEQTLWILLNIKPDSGTPIAGWPEAKVRQMCQNKSKGLGGAVSMTEFPLTTFSLKPLLHTVSLASCCWVVLVLAKHPL